MATKKTQSAIENEKTVAVALATIDEVAAEITKITIEMNDRIVRLYDLRTRLVNAQSVISRTHARNESALGGG